MNIIVIQQTIMENKLIMKVKLSIAILLLSALTSWSQTTVISGATIHIGNGKTITIGTIKFKDGKIISVESGENKTTNEGDIIINAIGKHVYPGFVCLNTFMGLNEIDAVRATRDYNESGQFNPNARTLIAYNTDSKQLPTALFNGIIYAQIVPSGGSISGTSSLMKTSGWNWEDAKCKADDGVHLNWPEIAPWGDIAKQQERVEKETQQIEEFFANASQYCNQSKPESINLRFEAMRGVLNGTKRLYIHVSGEEGIIKSIHFANSFASIKPVLVGAEGALKVKDVIKNNNIPVVINLTHRLPKYAHEDVDMPYKLPYLLMKEGITVAIGNGGSWESRNVMFHAGTAATYGLSKEEALMCITLNAAKVTGSDAQIGTLEVGKTAGLFISEGDALDMKSNNISHLYVDGKEVNLENEQQLLYKKFGRKYGFLK